jgi:hypothetical protein
VFLLLVFPAARAYGQETVFDIPSADVLDKGKVYGELDGTVRPVVPNANDDSRRKRRQFTFEQPVTDRLTLAAEWYTGNQAAGYVNPGAIKELNSKLTLYAAYQIGNAGVTTGNHQFLWELGYNFN